MLIYYVGCLQRDPSVAGNKLSLWASLVSTDWLDGLPNLNTPHFRVRNISDGASVPSDIYSFRASRPNLRLMHKRLGLATSCRTKMWFQVCDSVE
jgi:hypothetical protein